MNGGGERRKRVVWGKLYPPICQSKRGEHGKRVVWG
jgi:hypothetical protein